MTFLYNVWQSFKRNILLHLLTFFMLIIILYIATGIVGHKVETDDFFEHCGYNKDFADYAIVRVNQEKIKDNEDWNDFVVENKLNQFGCSAYFDCKELWSGGMISPMTAQALTLKKATGKFTTDYVGDGVSKPYEIMLNIDFFSQYKIGEEYEFTKTRFGSGEENVPDEKFKVKVVGYFEKYTIDLGFGEKFSGLFTENYPNFLLCGIPDEKISECIILSQQDYEKKSQLLDGNVVLQNSLKEAYELDKQTRISLVVSNIVRVVIVFLLMIATNLSFNLFKHDSTKRYNNIKRIVGENKLTNICVEVAINLIVFVLAVIVIGIVGAIDPILLGGTFPNIGFWISIVVLAVTYFGMLAISLFKVNNYLKK